MSQVNVTAAPSHRQGGREPGRGLLHINGAPQALDDAMRRVILACVLVLPLQLVIPAGAQDRAKPQKIADSILGVRVGASLKEVSARLAPLGTAGGRATRDGGRKEAWSLRETDFSHLALKTDAGECVVWVTGFLRPGREVAFSELGDLSLATSVTGSRAVWDVATPEGGYRFIARGRNQQAQVVQLISLASSAPP